MAARTRRQGEGRGQGASGLLPVQPPTALVALRFHPQSAAHCFGLSMLPNLTWRLSFTATPLILTDAQLFKVDRFVHVHVHVGQPLPLLTFDAFDDGLAVGVPSTNGGLPHFVGVDESALRSYFSSSQR